MFRACTEDLTIECHELRSVRYLSDGFCTSVRPVVDVVCTGNCLPIRQLPWYAEFIKVRHYTCSALTGGYLKINRKVKAEHFCIAPLREKYSSSQKRLSIDHTAFTVQIIPYPPFTSQTFTRRRHRG